MTKSQTALFTTLQAYIKAVRIAEKEQTTESFKRVDALFSLLEQDMSVTKQDLLTMIGGNNELFN